MGGVGRAGGGAAPSHAAEPGQFVDVTDAMGLTHTHATTQTIFDEALFDSVIMDEVPGLESDLEIMSSWITGGVAPGDYDGDGLPDLFVLGGDAGTSRLFRNRGDGTFTDQAALIGLDDIGEGRGVSCFDFDRDGDLDFAVSNNRGPFRLYENTLAGGAGFLTFRLRGQAPNTEGIGARVDLTSTAAGESGGLVRVLRAGSNFAHTATVTGLSDDTSYSYYVRCEDGAGNSETLAGATTVADGSWHHVAGVYDGSEVRLYVDGVLDASRSVGAFTLDTTQVLRLGERWSGGSDRFSGTVDEARVYDRALTAAEIQELFGSASP